MAEARAWDVLQSGVIPYRLTSAGNVAVCLVTSRTRGRWIIPKGFIEPDLEPWESAAKEGYEEAGVLGDVSDECLGSFTYDKTGMRCKVDVYPLLVSHVMPDWPESLERERVWLPAGDAAKRADEEAVGGLILELVGLVGRA
jgi:8-oxo-dGTP pyrophosphatase MutT (NUDIX family)